MQHGKVQRSTSYLTKSAANRPLDWLLQDTPYPVLVLLSLLTESDKCKTVSDGSGNNESGPGREARDRLKNAVGKANPTMTRGLD